MISLAKTKQAGFTLVELIIAITISTIVMLLLTQTFTTAIRHTRTVAAEAQLVNAGVHLTDVLALEIRPGSSVTSPTAQEIVITHADYSTTSIAYVSGDILLDGTSVLNPNVTANYLSFTVIEKTVQISYELTTDIGSVMPAHPFAATTTVALRN